jgi:DNA repair exonuclease SbcCD ATPase subunit
LELIPLSQEDVYQRLTKVETKVEEHEKKLEKQQDKNDVQTEWNTLLKMQIETNKNQEKQMEKFGDTLDRVNENLTNLNISQQQMKQDMNEIGSRVTDIEKNQEDIKIDPLQLFKGILSYVATGIGSIAIAVVIWYLTK